MSVPDVPLLDSLLTLISYKNSLRYNLHKCFCWRFGNCCRLHRNDCQPGVATVDSK